MIYKIQDRIEKERLEEKRRQTYLKKLKYSIIYDNKLDRDLREKYGKGPYTMNQIFKAKYGDIVRILCEREDL